MSGRISFVIDVEDKATLGAVGQTLLFMAGLSAAAMVAELRPHMAPAAQEFTELQPGEMVNEPGAPVDTAAVFSQAAAAPPTPPDAAVAPPAPVAAPSAPTPPTPPAAPTPPAPGAVELDKQGLPWDARINTKNKEKTQKGIWKTSKGLPEGLYDQVIAELKSVMALNAGQPAAPAVPPTPPTPAAPPVTTPGVGAAPITTAPQPPSATPAAPPSPTPVGAPAVPPVPPVPVTGAEEAPTTYAQLLQHITKHMSAQKITSDEINLVCAQNGLPSLNMAANAPQLIPAIYAGCAAIWNSRP